MPQASHHPKAGCSEAANLLPFHDMKRLHIIVEGKVQGVGFRQFTVKQAAELGITGWVRNLPDGRVEALAEGIPGALAAFLRLLERGPRLARVEKVTSASSDLTQSEFISFEFRR